MLAYLKSVTEKNSLLGAMLGALTSRFTLQGLEHDSQYWLNRLNVDIYIAALVYTATKRVIELGFRNRNANGDIVNRLHRKKTIYGFDAINQATLTLSTAYLTDLIPYPIHELFGISSLLFNCIAGELINEAFRNKILNRYSNREQMFISGGIFILAFIGTTIAGSTNSFGEASHSDLLPQLATMALPGAFSIFTLLLSYFSKSRSGGGDTNISIGDVSICSGNVCNCCVRSGERNRLLVPSA